MTEPSRSTAIGVDVPPGADVSAFHPRPDRRVVLISCFVVLTAVPVLVAYKEFAKSDGPVHARAGVSAAAYHEWKDAILLSNDKVEAVIVPSIGRVMQFRFQIGRAHV